MPERNHNESSFLLMHAARAARSLDRMAYQIAEDNRHDDEILLLGIKDRGFAIAEQLQRCLKKLSENKIGSLQIMTEDWEKDQESLKGLNTRYNYVVLVDDVIFSGQTMFRALGIVREKMDVPIVRTAALIDRGHRTLPLEATFTGLILPTKLDEHVSVYTTASSVEKVVLQNY